VILIATASSDTYITNKLIDGVQAVSGNVGRAGTIDIFKLYNESSYVTSSLELSRGLIKFDLSQAKLLSSSSINISHQSFKAIMSLKSLSIGQPTPSNFEIEVFPLANPFVEGLGRDVISFADVDYANFLEKSSGSFWFTSGAGQQGSLGDSNIDYFVSGNLSDGNGLSSLKSNQQFSTGLEDLSIDVTKIVSATIAGIIPDNGFRISFSSQQENDNITRFVKRFASRHVREQSNRPTLTLSYDNSIVDNHSSSYFDISNSYVIHNTIRGQYRNFTSGTNLTSVTGSNCIIVRFSTGSYVNYVTASQVQWGSQATGIYSASLSIDSSNSGVITGSVTIKSALDVSGSIRFDERWTSLDKSVTFFSGSIVMTKSQGKVSIASARKLRSTIFSTPTTATRGTDVRLRVSFFDDYENNKSSRMPVEPQQLQIQNCRIRLRDTISGKLLFDFNDEGSKMSNDSLSNYFDLQTHCFPVGVPILPEFKFNIDGQSVEILNNTYKLIVSE
jgi:hypothetical protein